jgi:hypothetical protein
MVNKPYAVVIALAILGFSFNSYAASCNRQARIHQEKANQIISSAKKYDDSRLSRQEIDFALCMIAEKKDRDAFMVDVRLTQKLVNLVADFSGMTAAVTTYNDRYRAWPGDDIGAATRWPGRTANATTPSGKQGNGKIEGAWNSSRPTDESFLAIQHMYLAGFLKKGELRNVLGGKIGVTGTSAGTTP